MIWPMKKLHLGSLILLTLLLSGCSQIPFLAKKQSALQVNSTPPATVSVNGNQVGQTPYYDDKLKPGKYTVRVLVDNDPSKDWQTEVNLAASVVTVVSRQFGTTANDSSYYLLTLEPINQKDSSQLDVTTTPENVIVKVDNRPEGFSPLHLENVTEGDHTLTLTAPGYQELTIKAQTKNSYKLIVTAQLAKALETAEGTVIDQASESGALTEATPSGKLTPSPTGKVTPTPKATPTGKVTSTPKVTPTGKLTPTPTSKTTNDSITKPYVIITDTPTGWLRVHSEPNASTENEVAKVDVGDKFPFIEANDSGWYQIEYESGKQGWIVTRYANLVK
jgi:hypothetical protein